MVDNSAQMLVETVVILMEDTELLVMLPVVEAVV